MPSISQLKKIPVSRPARTEENKYVRVPGFPETSSEGLLLLSGQVDGLDAQKSVETAEFNLQASGGDASSGKRCFVHEIDGRECGVSTTSIETSSDRALAPECVTISWTEQETIALASVISCVDGEVENRAFIEECNFKDDEDATPPELLPESTEV